MSSVWDYLNWELFDKIKAILEQSENGDVSSVQTIKSLWLVLTLVPMVYKSNNIIEALGL